MRYSIIFAVIILGSCATTNKYSCPKTKGYAMKIKHSVIPREYLDKFPTNDLAKFQNKKVVLNYDGSLMQVHEMSKITDRRSTNNLLSKIP